MIYRYYKIFGCLLITLLLIGCVPQSQTTIIPLTKAPIANYQQKHKNFSVKVSKKLSGVADMGGYNSISKIKFKNVIPWLNQCLAPIAYTECKSQQNKNITLMIVLNKLYSNLNSDIPVGHIVLQGKYYNNGHLVMNKYYSGQYVTSFLDLNGVVGSMQNSLNSAISEVIPHIQQDICKLAS